MREYQEELVTRLRESGHFIEVRGVRTVCKEVPDGKMEHRLDPRVLAEERERADNAARTEKAVTIEEAREEMGCFNYNLNTVQIYTSYLKIMTSCGEVKVWMYFPKKGREQGGRRAYVQVHGGAFFGGSVFAVENQCRLLAERGDCVVFNVDYALAPEYPWPIPCTQVWEVLVYLHQHAKELGIDPHKIAMGGDSAGGNLTAVCAQMDRDRGTGYLALQVLLYPKLTFTNDRLPGYERTISAFAIVQEEKQYLQGLIAIGSEEANAGDERVYVQGREDVTNPYISPAFGEKKGLCRTLLLLAEYDGLRLEGEFYAEKLQAAGVQCRVIRYQGMRHGFFDKLGIFPQTEDAVDEIAAAIRGI